MMRRRSWLAPLLLLSLLAQAPADPIAWAFPGAGIAEPLETPPGGFTLLGSTEHFEARELRDRGHVPDWRPASHPLAPASVLAPASPGKFACGFCHLPNGRGRPENAALAGLPAAYIEEQVRDIAAGARDVHRDWVPITGMVEAAKTSPAADVAAAARYFAALGYVPNFRVVEAARIPAARAQAFLYRLDPAAPPESLGERIVEAPDDFRRFELRDETTTYVAYVPVGAVERGRSLAASGGAAAQPCAVCHGDGLAGSEIAPPLAGRSPSYLFRQLHAFKIGTRHGDGGAPMLPVAAGLSTSEMIALAAYAGSLKP